jgi:hypothetical protein
MAQSKASRAAWTINRQARRTIREREFGAAIAATNDFRSSPVYGVIQTDDLALPVLPAAKNCVLFLWVRQSPLHVEALAAMKGWGFTYKTEFIWVKGDVARAVSDKCGHETILLGTRGKVPAPAPGTQISSVFEGESGREDFAAWIARTFPSTPHFSHWSGAASAYRALASIDTVMESKSARGADLENVS